MFEIHLLQLKTILVNYQLLILIIWLVLLKWYFDYEVGLDSWLISDTMLDKYKPKLDKYLTYEEVMLIRASCMHHRFSNFCEQPHPRQSMHPYTFLPY